MDWGKFFKIKYDDHDLYNDIGRIRAMRTVDYMEIKNCHVKSMEVYNGMIIRAELIPDMCCGGSVELKPSEIAELQRKAKEYDQLREQLAKLMGGEEIR